MAEQRRIGLLTPFFQPIPAYGGPASRLGVELAIVTPRRINWSTEEVEALVWDGASWQLATVPLPRAFYNRFYGPKPQVVNRLELLVGKNKVFNHVTRFDKLTIHQALSRSPLLPHLPRSQRYSPEGLRELLKDLGEVILKPRTGQLGLLIYLIRKRGKRVLVHHGTQSPIATFGGVDELLTWLEEVADSGWLIQQFIPAAAIDGRIFDVRILVQKDAAGTWQPSGALSRVALRYSYITNVSQAILPAARALEQAFPETSFLPQLEELSLKAAQLAEGALGSLGEVSVDFCLDTAGKIWIIELNGKPMKSMFGALGATELVKRVYERPLSYALHLCSTHQ